MPIYEYQCQSCQHKMESFQRTIDHVLQTCPECHQDTLVKLISAAAFQLKGTGWYETDFKKNQQATDSKPSEQSDGQADKSDKSKKTETSDSQSTAKSESKAGSKQETTVAD